MNETKVEDIALERIRPSKTNPRKHFDGDYINELGASIREKGIIQPLTLRPDWCIGKSDEEVAQVNGNAPAPDFFEIVAGECRYRGAKVAERADAPSIVRILGDKESLEIQLIENIQRQDITPVEEAEVYRRLIEMGHTVETIHQRTGLVRRTIYGKLKLIHAPDFLLEALEKKIIGERVCEIVGRIPLPEMRERAAREILKPGLLTENADTGMFETVDQPMSSRSASVHVQTHYMRSLNGAPFEQKDETLVPPIIEDATGERIGGGACTDCPLRSGNSLLVQGEIKRPDVCMNPKCYAMKCDAHFARLQETAVAEGKKLLSDAEAAEVFELDGSLSFGSPYALLTQQPDRQEVNTAAGKKIPSWKKLLENLESKPQITVARDPRGRIVELVDRNLAIEAVNLAAKQKGEKSIFERAKESGSRSGSSAGGNGGAYNKEQEAWREQNRKNKEHAKVNFQITLAAMEALIGAIEKRGAVKGFWPALIEASIDHAGHDGAWLICKLHDLDPKAKNKLTKKEGHDGAALEYGLSLTSEKEQLAFLVELLISQRVKIYNSGSMGGVRAVDSFMSFAKLYSVDVGKVEKAERAKAKEKPVKAVKEKKPAAKGQSDIKAAPQGKIEHKWKKVCGNLFDCERCGASGDQIGTSWPPVVQKEFLGKPCLASPNESKTPRRIDPAPRVPRTLGKNGKKAPNKFKSGARLTAKARKRLSDAMKARWAARLKDTKKGGKK